MKPRYNNQPFLAPTPNYWADQIYQAAKSQNAEALKKLLAQGVCIDQHYQGEALTPAGKLAAEGNKKAVLLLIQFGANVNFIGLGAIQGGQRDYAEFLRLNYGASVDYIAQGAAWLGQRDYAEYLRINHGADVSYIAMGAARAGDRDYIESLSINTNSIYNAYIGMYAAWGGQRDYAETLRNPANVHLIAMGAAMGGHLDYVEYLRSQGASVHFIAMGAAEGGYLDYAESLRQNNGANLDYIAMGAAYAGQVEYAESLRINYGANVSAIANYAVWGGQRDYAEYLYTNHRANVNQIAQGAINGRHFKNETLALHELTLIANTEYRNKLAKALTTYERSIDFVKLAAKANKLRHIQDKYHLNYEQALIWINNKDVRNLIFYGDGLMKATAVKVDGIEIKTRPGLPQDIFRHLMTYLAPALSHEDATLLQNNKNKLLDNLNKQSLLNDLNQHAKKGFFHKRRAASLLQAAKEIRTEEELNVLLGNQLLLFASPKNLQANSGREKHTQALKSTIKGEYYKIVKRHYRG